MSAREPGGGHDNPDHIERGHSDLGPSSKDWLPGSAGRDEDFTPEKDLWTQAHKGNLGAGRPGEDIQGSATPGGGSYQPGTHHQGRSWQSRRPDPLSPDDKLDQALKDSFPTSDPPQPAQPGVTGWDLEDDERFRSRYRSGAGGSGEWGEAWRDVRTTIPGWAWAAVGLAVAAMLYGTLRGPRRGRRSPRGRP